MIQPQTATQRAAKNRKAIEQGVAAVREAESDGGHAVALQSVIEQARNFDLQNGCIPSTYKEMQLVPFLQTGLLPYAGDDSPHVGQTYRSSGSAGEAVRQPRFSYGLIHPGGNGVSRHSHRTLSITKVQRGM
jgi:hypothetical protein